MPQIPFVLDARAEVLKTQRDLISESSADVSYSKAAIVDLLTAV